VLSPLQLAVYVDKPQLAIVLYDASPLCDSQGRTALMLAAKMGLEACIKTLLSCGASLLHKDEIAGDTAIHYACREGCTSCALRVLLSSSNRSNLMKVLCCKNRKGQTPLHVACKHGHVHVIDTFLSVCSSSPLAKLLHIHDDLNQTPLLTAVRSESTDVVMSLLMWRGNDHVGRHAATELSNVDSCPLTCVASAGSIYMVLLLLDFMDPVVAHEASFTLFSPFCCSVNSRGDSIRDYASLGRGGHRPLCTIITHGGAIVPKYGVEHCMCQGRCGGIDRTTGFASELHNFATFDKKAGSKLCQLPES
jgi:ankyrin repeat protein